MPANWKPRASAVVIAAGVLAGAPAAGAPGDGAPAGAPIADGGGPGCDCPGDADGDCRVGFLDLAITLGAWGPCPPACEPCPGDHDGDCDVDIDDLLLVLPNWGPCEERFFVRCKSECYENLADFIETTTDSDYVIWDATIKWRGVTSAGDAIDKCATRKLDFQREISVFVVGFGCEGRFSLGSGFQPGNDVIGREATSLTRNNAAWFGEQIKDSVTRITLWGCHTGADQEFIDALANEGLEVCAFSGRVADTLIQFRPYYFSEYRYEPGGKVCVP